MRKAAGRASVAEKVTPALSRWEDLRAGHAVRFDEMGGWWGDLHPLSR